MHEHAVPTSPRFKPWAGRSPVSDGVEFADRVHDLGAGGVTNRGVTGWIDKPRGTIFAVAIVATRPSTT